MSSIRVQTLVVLAFFGLTATGCYNTYRVPQDEFRKLQSVTALGDDGKLQDAFKDNPDELSKLANRGENDMVVVQADGGDKVAVGRDTRLFVRTEGGRRYQVTPFLFSMASNQMVDSQRDTLLQLNNLRSYEVDLLSTGKTVTVIAAGVVGAALYIIGIIASAGSKSF
jgi:hypothetical protein